MSDEKQSPLDGLGFRFQIGDIACHRAALEPWRADPDVFLRSDKGLVRLMVVERVAQECPGGVQLKYLVSAVQHDGNFSSGNLVLLDHELAPYPDRLPAEGAEEKLASRPRREQPPAGEAKA